MVLNASAPPPPAAGPLPPVRRHVDVGSVSLLTALFPNAAAVAASSGQENAAEQVNSDFVFALFIQEQEQAGLQVNP